MKIGDLVRFNDVPASSNGRIIGVVLRFDTYRGHSEIKLDSNDAFGSGPVTPLVEVLWETGPGWIARNRVEKIDVLNFTKEAYNND